MLVRTTGVVLPKRASLPKTEAAFGGAERELFPSIDVVNPTIIPDDMPIAYDHSQVLCSRSHSSELNVTLIIVLQAISQKLIDNPQAIEAT